MDLERILDPERMAQYNRAALRPKEWYHLTPPENVESIQRTGLLSAERRIWVYTHRLMEAKIAATQVFTLKYAVFQIRRPGITGRILKDRVGELTAPWHRIVCQERIDPKYLELIGQYDVDQSQPFPSDVYHNFRLFGWTLADTLEMREKMREGYAKLRAMNDQDQGQEQPAAG